MVPSRLRRHIKKHEDIHKLDEAERVASIEKHVKGMKIQREQMDMITGVSASAGNNRSLVECCFTNRQKSQAAYCMRLAGLALRQLYAEYNCRRANPALCTDNG
jgi:hypothetical protein